MKFQNILVPVLFTLFLIVSALSCGIFNPIVTPPGTEDTTAVDTIIVDTVVVNPFDTVQWSEFSYNPVDSIYRWQSAIIFTDTSMTQYFRFEVFKDSFVRVPIEDPKEYTNWEEGQTDALYTL